MGHRGSVQTWCPTYGQMKATFCGLCLGLLLPHGPWSAGSSPCLLSASESVPWPEIYSTRTSDKKSLVDKCGYLSSFIPGGRFILASQWQVMNMNRSSSVGESTALFTGLCMTDPAEWARVMYFLEQSNEDTLQVLTCRSQMRNTIKRDISQSWHSDNDFSLTTCWSNPTTRHAGFKCLTWWKDFFSSV